MYVPVIKIEGRRETTMVKKEAMAGVVSYMSNCTVGFLCKQGEEKRRDYGVDE